MQRGRRADWTTPSAVRLMASAGQTSAQVGWLQCMQTTGTVCVLAARSTYSRWIIDSPRCVSHSGHACTQAWQPMQRLGSMKKCSCSGFAMTLLLRLEHSRVLGWAVGLAHPAAADLVLRDLADRILGRHRYLIRALLSRPVVRDGERVGPNRGDDHGFQRDAAAARFGRRPLPVFDAKSGCELWMHLDPGLRVLFHQRPDASGLRAGQELADHAAGREEHRILGTGIVYRVAVVRDVESCAAIGEIERSRTFGDRVIAAALEQARRACVFGDRLAGLRVVAVTGPEHSHVPLDLLVGHARVIGDAAAAGDTKFLENLARTAEGEACRTLQRDRNVLDDPPVLARLSGTRHRLVDLDDAAFDLCDRPFILLVKAAGQDDVGVTRRVVQEEIDRRVELQLVETASDEVVVGERDLRIEADRQQPFDFAAIDLAEHLVGIDTWSGQLAFLNAPDAGNVAAMLGIGDVTPPGQLIALLPVLTTALAIRLTDDGAVAALGLADAARGEDEVDGAERVLHAVGVMLDASSVEQETRLRSPPPFGRLYQRSLRHTGDFRRAGERPLRAVLGDLVEAGRVLGDEIPIDPAALDHDLEDAGKEGCVPPGLHGQI